MYARAGSRDVTCCQLSERTFRTLRPSLLLSGARAACGPLGALGQDHQPGYLLADVRILVRAGLLRAIDDKVNAAGALRIPFVGLIRLFGFGALFGVYLSD